MEEIERAQERLQHIRSAEPILDALRMIALGTWQKAKTRQAASQRYSNRLLAMLPWLLPHLPHSRPLTGEARKPPTRRIVVVAGTERGLCGRFNVAVVEHAVNYAAYREEQGESVSLMALGARASRLFVAGERPLAWSGSLPIAALPTPALAFSLTQQWLEQFEANEIDAVTCVYNAYSGMGSYQPTTTPVLPPPLPKKRLAADAWLSPIIETNPVALYTHIVRQWTAAHFYALLLESAMAEHSVRYQLLESAGQNVERLIDELSVVVQAARQQAITREMQALAVGAGLVGAGEVSVTR